MDAPNTTPDLARRFIESLQALEQQGERGLDAMLALFAEDATLANAALDLGGEERRGRDGVRAFWSDYTRSLGGSRTEFHAVTQAPGTIGLFWTTQLPAAAGGEATRYEGATLLRLDPGGERIAALRGYYDTRALTTSAQA